MKLDRNLNGDGRGKYGLILNRRLAAIRNEAPQQYVAAIESAMKVLEGAGIIDWGTTPDTEFFVMRLRDINANAGLAGYGISATMRVGPEYGAEIEKLAKRAGPYHPNNKMPD